MSIDLASLEKLRSPLRGRCRKKPVTLTPRELAAELATSGAALDDATRKAIAAEGANGSAALAFLSTPFTELPRGLDVRVQALLAEKLGGNLGVQRSREVLMPLWLVSEGPAFAVDALALAAEGVPKAKDWREWRLHATFFRWELLRTELAIASEGAWEEAHARAAEHFEARSTIVRCALAYLFPEEPAWAARAAREWLTLAREPQKKNGDVATFAGYATLASLTDATLLAELCAHARATTGFGQLGDFAADAACLHQEATIGPLLEVFSIAEEPREAWSWARSSLTKLAKTLACFDDPRTIEALASRLDHKLFGPIAVEQLDRFPEAAIRVLAPALGEKSKKAERRVAQLDALLRGKPALAEHAALTLPPELARAVRQRVKALVPGSDATHATGPSPGPSSTEAPRDAWPPVLAAPPWRSKAPRAARPTLPGLVAPERPARLVVDQETRAKWAIVTDGFAPERQARGAQERMLAKARGNAHRVTKVGLDEYASFVPLQPSMFDDDLLREVWALPPFSSSFDLRAAERTLARLGDVALPGAIARLEVDPSLFPLALHLDTNRLAVHLARAFRRPSQRSLAQRALARFPETHAPALVALALSNDPERARDADLAAQALRWLAAETPKVVLEGAATHGDAARAAIEALLAIDPLEACPARPPRLSDFAEPESLPRVRLRDQRSLPLEAMRNLLEMLQFSPADPPYPGLAQIVEACDPASLDDLAWALVQGWDRSGGASANAWALRALGHVGSDAVVKKLAAEIRRWPREKAKGRALLALEVLAQMGTDVALLHLDELSRKARNKDVEAKAAALLAAVAETRELSPLELEDRLVPTLDLDARGERTLAVGGRVLRVRFDAALEPYLVDASGARTDKILKHKGDEPEALKRAQEAWKELRGDAAAVTQALVGRVERSMCEGRRWDVPTFRSLFVAHPLTQHVARRLVWATFEGDVVHTTFRVAEDGTLADAGDAELVLPDGAEVGLVHPLALEPPLLDAWRQRLLDYELLQPFEQLGRAVVRAEGDGNGRLAKVSDKEVSLGALLGGLEARGWRVTSPDGDGLMYELTRRFGRVTAYVTFSPGFRPREARPDKVTVGSAGFQALKRAADAPPLAYSELVRDLAVFGLA